MKKVIGALAVSCVLATAGAVLVRAAGMPLWAYGYVDPPPADSDYSKKCTVQRPVDCARGGTPPDDGRKRTLPGWARGRVDVSTEGGSLTVALRPPSPFAAIADSLEVSSSAWVRRPAGDGSS